MQKHVNKGISMLEPVGGSLRKTLPIILAHHDKFDGSGYSAKIGTQIPLEARIITVADVYDSLTSDRPYRKAMSPYEVREILVKGAGTEFDDGRRGLSRSVSERRNGSAGTGGLTLPRLTS